MHSIYIHIAIVLGKLSTPITPKLAYIHSEVLWVHIHPLITANCFLFFHALAFSHAGRKKNTYKVWPQQKTHEYETNKLSFLLIGKDLLTRKQQTYSSKLWARQLKYIGAMPRYFRTDKINWNCLTINTNRLRCRGPLSEIVDTKEKKYFKPSFQFSKQNCSCFSFYLNPRKRFCKKILKGANLILITPLCKTSMRRQCRERMTTNR